MTKPFDDFRAIHAVNAAGLALVVVGLPGAGCDHFASVAGRVTSCANGEPLGEAQVLAYAAESPDLIPVDRTGAFTSGVAAPQDALVRVTIQHEGYVTLNVPRWNTAGSHDVCLEPIVSSDSLPSHAVDRGL